MTDEKFDELKRVQILCAEKIIQALALIASVAAADPFSGDRTQLRVEALIKELPAP